MILNIKSIITIAIFLFIVSSSVLAEEKIEEKWLSAVSKGNVKEALKFAEQMVPQNSLSGKINPQYAAIAKEEKIGEKFLSSPFNEWDFRLWYDAWFLKGIANKAKAKFKKKDKNFDQNVINILFNTVVKKIKPKEEKKALLPWPTGVWRREFGVCDRQSWLLAELLYQAGFETQIIYLINPETGKSPHTICEIQKDTPKGNSIFTIADPYSNVLLHKMSAKDLVADKILMQKIWPKKEEWWRSLGSSIFWTPSYPQDYCEKNQLLYKKLKEKLGNECPRFGEDPEKRGQTYYKSANNSFKKGLWFYPFRLMKAEIDIINKRKSESKK